jgi:DnaJ-class molecular chaperone
MNDYDILGIKPGASEDEIKKAFKKQAVLNHPDKGGDPENFKRINDAYTNLTKPRDVPDFPNFARDFFGFANAFGHGPGPGVMFRQTVQVGITLEELFKGKRIKVNNIEVVIHPNTPLHAHIEVPGTNIIVRLKVIRHPVYQVENGSMNLIYKQTISLCEALLGFKGRIKHPNGTMMFCSTNKGKIIRQNEIIRIMNKGIPIDNRGNMSNLLLVFEVNMPSSIDLKYESVIKEMLKFDVPNITPGENEDTINLN